MCCVIYIQWTHNADWVANLILSNLRGLLGPEVPLPQVPLHVSPSIVNLRPGAVKALLKLGDARVNDFHSQAPVWTGRAALDTRVGGAGRLVRLDGILL